MNRLLKRNGFIEIVNLLNSVYKINLPTRRNKSLMRMLYNQRKKLHKDTLFFGYGKKKLQTKRPFNYLYPLFLISQSDNLNNDDYSASVLKHSYLKHNTDCFSQVTVYLSSEHIRSFDKYQ